MSFSLADFKPKASDWLIPNLLYEGPGNADFTSPIGSVMGPFIATFNDRGEQSILATCEQISCDPDYQKWGAIAFLSGAKIEREDNVESWGFGGLNNPCKELKITTHAGTFTASHVWLGGMTAQLAIAKPEDVKPTPLQFRVSQGKFETGNLNKPQFFVLPLLNCIAEPGNTLSGSHPLRIYPTPIVPDSLVGKERLGAALTAQKHNSVIGFHLSGRLCFIERLADYDQRLASLKGGNQCIMTAVLVGEVGEESVATLEEFRSWFPMEVISALGFASGVDTSFSWVEIRDEQGELIRRLHGRTSLPTFDEGDVLLTGMDAQANSGMGPFLTSYLSCAPNERSYLEAVMNHARLGSMGISLRLYDNLDHLVRAFECLCREHGFIQQNLLPRLTAPIQGQVKGILAGAVRELQSLIRMVPACRRIQSIHQTCERYDSFNARGKIAKFFLSGPSCLFRRLSGMHKRHVDQVLAQEPDLQFIRTENVADHKVIGAIVADRRSAARQRAALTNDDLMGIQQARELYRNFLSSAGWAFNLSGFGHIRSHGDAHPTEKLNTLGNIIHQFHLFAKMFIKQQVKLVKGGPSHLPVRFLVKVAERHGVREQLVQLCSHFQANWLFQLKRKQKIYRAVCLDLCRSLVKSRLGADFIAIRGSIISCH